MVPSLIVKRSHLSSRCQSDTSQVARRLQREEEAARRRIEGLSGVPLSPLTFQTYCVRASAP